MAHSVDRTGSRLHKGFGSALATLTAVTLLCTPVVYGDISETSGDLLDEIQTIHSNMPGRDSEGFVPPTAGEVTAWRDILEALLDDDMDTADSLITTDFPEYLIFRFTDTGLDSSEYYLLREAFPVTLGWGTLILKPCYAREIAIEIPHPRFETNTSSEGADIFRRTGARLFVMAGTHRCANSEASPCDGSSTVCNDGVYHVSDMAHLTECIYQVAHEVFTETYPEGYAFSLHGTSRSNCEDIFLSNAHASDSQPILYDLKGHMIGSGNITIAVAGDGTSTCPLHGSTNTQGRFTNGSPDPCTQPVSSTTGFFIHAEQRRRVRDSLAIYSKFIDAINETITDVQSSITPDVHPSEGLTLSLPHPNPGSSQIRFTLTVPLTQSVKAEAFDLLGRRIALIHEGVITSGRTHSLAFDAEELPSGLYFVRVSGDETAVTRMVTLLK